VSWKWGPPAPGNPWRARTLEWQVSSPPPIFNFDEIPQVVGGPYEYGVPGAVHAVMNGARERVPVGAGAGHASGSAGNGHGAGGGHGGEGDGHDTVARE
jgi:cytochrome c oxidase subunit I